MKEYAFSGSSGRSCRPARAEALAPEIRRKENRRSLPMDALCCWLITVGVLLAMRQLFRFENPMAAIFLRATVITALFVLLTRRWWIPPAAAGGVSLLLLLTGTAAPAVDFLRGLFAWGLDQFPRISSYNTPVNIELVQWIITLAVCSAVFLLIRRAALFTPLAVLAVILIAVIYLNGFRQNHTALLFLFAGTCPYLTRSLSRKLNRRTNGRSGSSRRMLLASLAFCAAGSLLVSAVVPSDASVWKNPTLATALDSVRRTLKGEKTLPLSNAPFTLKSSGLQPNADRLGGNLSLSHEPVMRVRADAPAMMKGMVYGIYTGKGWEAGSTQDYLLQDAMYASGAEAASSREAFEDTFDVLRPRDKWGSNPLADAMPLSLAEVTLFPGGYSLYFGDRITEISSDVQSSYLLFNTRSEVFSRTCLPEKYGYRFVYRRFDRQNAGLADQIEALERDGVRDDAFGRAAADYLQLPDNLPSSVAAKAQEIAGGLASPYRQMEQLEAYLSTRYTYTLTPGNVPRNRDFVEYFLESGEGYCVYFASAMTVMARTLGVPARFVIGYGLEASETDWMAYADNAHAWVECYILGVGWIPFDPTAGSSYRAPEAPDTVQPTAPTLSSARPSGTTTAPSAASAAATTLPSGVSSAAGQGTAPVPGGTAGGGLWLILLAAAAVILLSALTILRLQRKRHAFDLAVLRARQPDAGACADTVYTDLLRQLRLLGFEPLPAETMRRFGERAADTLSVPAAENAGGSEGGPTETLLREAFGIVMDWRYGEQTPAEEDLERLVHVHERLESLVRQKLGGFLYFLRRRLFW